MDDKQYWIEEYTYLTCPVCGEEYSDEILYMHHLGREAFNYCPSCGERLYFKEDVHGY